MYKNNKDYRLNKKMRPPNTLMLIDKNSKD